LSSVLTASLPGNSRGAVGAGDDIAVSGDMKVNGNAFRGGNAGGA
jgi:hypothetical protein